jgi:hypothetical protein
MLSGIRGENCRRRGRLGFGGVHAVQVDPISINIPCGIA